MEREESASFFAKKEAKKLLFAGGFGTCRARTYCKQTFLASFFQKRSAFFRFQTVCLVQAFFGMPQVPEALMSGDQAFDALAAVGIWRDGSARQHVFEDMQQLLGDFVVALVAGMVEGDQDFIRQATAIARGGACRLQAFEAGFVCFVHACQSISNSVQDLFNNLILATGFDKLNHITELTPMLQHFSFMR